MRNAPAIEASRKNIAIANSNRAVRRMALPKWTCASCGKQEPATVHQRRKKYCSRACTAIAYKVRFAGNSNNNYRDAARKKCEACGNEYRAYSKQRKFCSHACYVNTMEPPSGGHRKDANHEDIVSSYEALGCRVFDMHTLGGGAPDLIVLCDGITELAEVKNPNTHYGRKGLSRLQSVFAAEWPVTIVRTHADVVIHVGNMRKRARQ